MNKDKENLTMSESEYVIVADSLVKQFPNKLAVNGISLKVKKGEVFGILGPNGAGKSTFLKMLTTLIPITSGKATIFGKDVEKNSSEVRKHIGLTGQFATIDETLTAMENLMIFSELNGLSKVKSKERSLELLKQFSLIEAKDIPIKEFSGGMRRRLDLAVSLITSPPIIFLDEPTTGLDPVTRGEMWDVIRNLVQSGSTVVLTTQYLEEADQLADRIAVINHGEVVAEGTPEELKSLVGDTYFEITVANVENCEKAQKIVADLTETDVVSLPERASFAVKMLDTTEMISILENLKEQNIDVKEFTVRKPTLDEVFIELTKGGK